MKLINKKENIFGDDIAFVEQYDFSTANMSEENRIKAITTVASICYQNPKAIGSESLYNRLLAESKGLPSSSFEFVPVLFLTTTIREKFNSSAYMNFNASNTLKYGELIYVDGMEYLLTNYRALIYDVENTGLNSDILKHFNTPEECEIIKKHFKVFLYKVDLPTRSQMVRHRISWQELSRRYVSAKRVPFEFYISEKMKGLESEHEDYYMDGMSDFETDFINIHSTEKLIEMCIEHYYQALEAGIKPQEARRIIPQAAYTQIWGAFQPKQLENYFKLRLDEHAQWEIRQTAIAMQELINNKIGLDLMLDNNQIGCRPCLFIQEDDDSIGKNIFTFFGMIFIFFFGGMVFILGSILIILWHGAYDSIRIYKILKNKEKRKK